MHWFCHPHWWRRHHRRVRVILIVGDFAVELIRDEVIHMATELKVGQTLPLSISFLDQDGKPMDHAPTVDVAPTWANTSPATEELTVPVDGMTASARALAAGTDTVRVSLMVAGAPFSATLDVNVTAVVPTQTLTSIEIVPGMPS